MDSQILTYWDIGIISFFGGYSSWHFLLSEIHFFDGSHCDHHFKNPVFDHLDYLFRKEVQATLYGSFGIKI